MIYVHRIASVSNDFHLSSLSKMNDTKIRSAACKYNIYYFFLFLFMKLIVIFFPKYYNLVNVTQKLKKNNVERVNFSEPQYYYQQVT